MKSKEKPAKTLYFSFFFGIVLVFLFLFHRPFFIAAGKFLSPEGIGIADVVILEGCELAREKGVQVGISLLSSGRAKRLIIIDYSNNGSNFGKSSDYVFFTQQLEELGLNKERMKVIGVPNNHPVTLTEAKIVLTYLSKNNIKSAILLAEGFHTRRSYWAYKQIGLPLDIKIIPVPYFLLCGNHAYRNEDWWQRRSGIYSFVEEWLQFLYYVLRGYIPAKSFLVV